MTLFKRDPITLSTRKNCVCKESRFLDEDSVGNRMYPDHEFDTFFQAFLPRKVTIPDDASTGSRGFQVRPLIQLIDIKWCVTIQCGCVFIETWAFDSNYTSLEYGAKAGSVRKAGAG